MAAVGYDRELHAIGAAVVEERLDRRPDRPAGVEDVVDEDDGTALERKIEAGGADQRLCVQRRLAAAHLDVVAVEGDVDGAELDLLSGELGDQVPQALRERDAAGVDADERDSLELGIGLDDLVGDPRQAALDRLGVEQDLL